MHPIWTKKIPPSQTTAKNGLLKRKKFRDQPVARGRHGGATSAPHPTAAATPGRLLCDGEIKGKGYVLAATDGGDARTQALRPEMRRAVARGRAESGGRLSSQALPTRAFVRSPHGPLERPTPPHPCVALRVDARPSSCAVAGCTLAVHPWREASSACVRAWVLLPARVPSCLPSAPWQGERLRLRLRSGGRLVFK